MFTSMSDYDFIKSNRIKFSELEEWRNKNGECSIQATGVTCPYCYEIIDLHEIDIDKVMDGGEVCQCTRCEKYFYVNGVEYTIVTKSTPMEEKVLEPDVRKVIEKIYNDVDKELENKTVKGANDVLKREYNIYYAYGRPLIINREHDNSIKWLYSQKKEMYDDFGHGQPRRCAK